MSLLDVDIRRLALQLLPMCLRKPLMGALVYAVTKAAAMELDDILSYRNEVNEEMRRNGQTCNLRRVLNNLFDPEQRGILVVEPSHGTGVVLSMRADGKTLIIPLALPCRGYGGSTEVDFFVRIPGRLYGVVDQKQVNSIIRRYKLVGMRFSLEYTNLLTVSNTGIVNSLPYDDFDITPNW